MIAIVAQGAQEVVEATQADNTAAWLAFIGAILVAALAAVTAQWRQRQQLRHERELRDLDELRNLLDECAQAAACSSSAFLDLISHAYEADRGFAQTVIDEAGGQASAPRPEGRQAAGNEAERGLVIGIEALVEAVNPIFGLYQRLVLRLGEPHEICRQFLGVQKASNPRHVVKAITDTDPGTGERKEALTSARMQLRDAHFGFLNASKKVVGVVLPR